MAGLWKKVRKPIAGLFVLLVTAPVVLWVGLNTEFGRSAVAHKVAAMLTQSLGIIFELDEVSIGLTGKITITGIRIRDGHGDTPIASKQISGKVDLLRILSGVVDVSNLQIEGAEIQANRNSEGQLNLVSMFEDGDTTPKDDGQATSDPFIRKVRVRGRILASAVAFSQGSTVSVTLAPIEADLSLDWRQDAESVRARLDFSDAELHVVLADPAIDRTASLSGILVYDSNRILIQDLRIEAPEELGIAVGLLQYNLASGQVLGAVEARGFEVVAQQRRLWRLQTVVVGEDAQKAVRLYARGFLGPMEIASAIHVQTDDLSVQGQVAIRGVNMAFLMDGAPKTDWAGALKGSWVNQRGHPQARAEWSMSGTGHPWVGGGLALRSFSGWAQLAQERLKLGVTAVLDEGWLKAKLTADLHNGGLDVQSGQLELAMNRNPVPGMTPSFVNPRVRVKANLHCSGRYPHLRVRIRARVEEPTQSPVALPLLNIEASLRDVPGSLQGQAEVEVPTMTIETRRVDEVRTVLDWKGDALRVAFTGTSTLGDLSGQGVLSGLQSPAISFSGKGDFSATTSSQGLPQDLFIRRLMWSGSGDLRDGHLSGKAELTVDANLDAQELRGGFLMQAYEQTWTATAALERGRGTPLLRLSAEGRRAPIESPSQLASLIDDGSIELDDLPVALLTPWLGRPNTENISGELAARLSINRAKESARGYVAFRRMKMQTSSRRTDGRVDISLQKDASYMRLRAKQGSGELQALGTIRAGLSDGLRGRVEVFPRRSIHLAAQLDGFDVADLAREFTLVACDGDEREGTCGFPSESISGRLTATATLAGSLLQPRGKLAISTSSLTMDGMPYGDLRATASLAENVLAGQVRALDPRGGQMSLDFEKLPESYMTRLHADRWSVAPLTFVFRGSQSIGKVEGLLSGDVSANGQDFSRPPQVQGSLVLKGGGVELAAPLPAVSGAAITMEMTGTKGNVVWDATVSRGKTKGAVNADWKNEVMAKMNAAVTDMFVAANGYPAMVSLVADANGTMKNGEAQVAVELSHGKVRMASGFSRKLHPTELPEDLQRSMSGKTKTASVARAKALPLKIALTTRSPILVRSPDVQGGLTLDLSYRSSPIKQLDGTARLANGYFRLGGRDWTIVKAVVGFTDEHELTIDVELEYQAQEALVRLYLRGTPSKPDLTLGSSPSIFDQSSLMAFVLGGELDSARGTGASAAGGIIGGLLSNAASSEVEGLLPIDTIVLDPTAYARLGKWIFSRIFLAYQRNFDPREDENLTEGIVRYDFLPGWMVESRYGDRGVGSVDLLWQKRF
jgi:hypothetical protein